MPTVPTQTRTHENRTGERTDLMDVRKDVCLKVRFKRGQGGVFDGETEGVCSRQYDQSNFNKVVYLS